MKGIFFILIVLYFPTNELYSQFLPDSIEKRIDYLFQKWDKTSVPGCAIGIVRNDTLIYAKGYGMANLENSIPITPETVFYMASVSKQFTGYSIILLARQGKLKLDDDIRQYNNGKEITYASGIGNSIYNGRIRYSHSGGLAGYRTYVSAFPELKMGFIVFSNDGDFNSSAKANELADIFFNSGNINRVNPTGQVDGNRLLIHDSSGFRKYMGDYVDDDGTRLNFNLNEGKMSLNVQGQTFNLYQFSRDTIALATSPDTRFLFSISGNDTIATQNSPGETRIFRKYFVGNTLTNKQLKLYTGTYYSPELGCNYGIELRNEKLILTSNKYDDAEISLVGSDDIYTNNWWMGHLKIIRDNKNMVTGFEINDGQIMHLKFVKLK